LFEVGSFRIFYNCKTLIISGNQIPSFNILDEIKNITKIVFINVGEKSINIILNRCYSKELYIIYTDTSGIDVLDLISFYSSYHNVYVNSTYDEYIRLSPKVPPGYYNYTVLNNKIELYFYIYKWLNY
jgi:hypothetical protein